MSSKLKMPTAKQLPSGSFMCRIRVNGNRYSFVRDTEEEAVRSAMLFRLQGSGDKDERKQAREMLTLSEAIDGYIERRSNVLSPSTIRGYRSYQKHRFQSVMNMKLSDVDNWQAVVNAEAKEVEAKTVKNAWGLVASSLKDVGIDVGSVRIPQIVRNEHLFLQPEEVKVFVNAIKGHRFEAAYLLGLHSARRSEICAVKKSDISNGYIHIHGSMVYDEHGDLIERKENKTSSSNRMTPVMIPRLTELAKQCKGEYLCTCSPSSLTHPLNVVCRQNGLPEVGLHGLRHSFASLCYHLGISEMQCMEFGGWSDINVMRKIYTHLADTDRKKAEEKLKGFFA